jgi:hypothetical protein
MAFFCYVYSRGSSTPHMEAIDSPTLYGAKTRLSQMLAEHARAVRAELFHDERKVASLSRDEATRRLVQP